MAISQEELKEIRDQIRNKPDRPIKFNIFSKEHKPVNIDDLCLNRQLELIIESVEYYAFFEGVESTGRIQKLLEGELLKQHLDVILREYGIYRVGDDIPHCLSKVLRTRLLPERLWWPSFEDGSRVNFNDSFLDEEGFSHTLSSITFKSDKTLVLKSDEDNVALCLNENNKKVVKTPTLYDYDGQIIKTGDTVRLVKSWQ